MSRSSVSAYIDNQLPDNNNQLIKPVNARNVTKKLLDDSFNKADDDSDDINEGATNLFFTDERSADSIAMVIQDSGDGNLTWSYDDTAGTLTPTITGVSQNIQDVLTDGNDAGGLLIKNIGDGVDTQDAVTLSQLTSAVGAIPVLFVGWFSSLAGLELTFPTAEIGQYGIVDAGSGSDAVVYFWDNDEGWVPIGNTLGYTAENAANKTGTIAGNESSTSLYPHVKGVVDWMKQGFTGLLSSLSLTKATPIDADSIVINDSADSNKTKLTTWANVKATLKTYFDTLYALKASAQSISGIWSWSAAINEAQGTDIASATTTDVGAATGNYVNVTGTTTITGLGTVQAGVRRIVTFTGSLTLTHNATSLILPSSTNITTFAGDVAHFISLGSGNWKCVSYTRQNGTALIGSASAASETVAGIAEIATQAETNTGTDDLRIVTPLKLATWWTNIKTLAHTWSLKQIFTGGVQVPSAAGVYDSNGNKAVQITPTTSAVDYLDVNNGVANVTLSSAGTSANTNFLLRAKGAASLLLGTNSSNWLQITGAGVVKLLGYTATETKVATILADGSFANTYGVRDMRINEWWTPLSSIVLAAKTSVMGNDYGAVTIATADINRLGARFKHKSRHKYTVAASGQGNVQLDLDWGSTNLFTTGSLAIDNNQQGLTQTVYLEFDLMTIATGASGKLAGTVQVTYPALSTGSLTFTTYYFIDIEATVDLTAEQQLKFSVTWGTASVNSWSSKSGITEMVA